MPTIVRVEDLPSAAGVLYTGALLYVSQSGVPYNTSIAGLNSILTGLGQTNAASLSLISGLSGSLNQTGSLLYNDIIGLSGILNTNITNTNTNTTNISNNTSSITSINGSITNVNTSLTVISGTLNIVSGQAGVSSVNGKTGAITLVGQGQVTITTNGQNINISGATGGGGGSVVPSVSFGTAINWAAGNTFYTSLNGTATYTFSNNQDGQTIVVLVSGSNAQLINWPANVRWPNGLVPTPSTGFNDVYTFVQIQQTIYGTVIQNY